MIGALHKRNSCITLHPPGGHYSRKMSKSGESIAESTDIRNANGSTNSTNGTSGNSTNGPVTVRRCHSSSKVEKTSSAPVNLKENINTNLQSVAQNLCLIESMIPCMRSEEDSEELLKQLRETNQKLQQVLPALHVFMMTPPAAKEEKERCQYEKKKLRREFEAALKGYKKSHDTLGTAIKRMKADVAL